MSIDETTKTGVVDQFTDAKASPMPTPADPTESGQALVASVVARYAASTSRAGEHSGAHLIV